MQRLLLAEVGAGPLALARTQRASTARTLIETSTLALSDIAFAAGFASIRSFNDTIRKIFDLTPSQLRQQVRRGHAVSAPSATVGVRLPFRPPLEPEQLFGHLIATAIPGVEEWDGSSYRRTLRLPHGPGIVALTPPLDGATFVAAEFSLADPRDLRPAVARCRRMLDLDADPTAVDTALATDPRLAPSVTAAPGRRVPRVVDGAEFALRAVLGQQVSTAAARTLGTRLVQRCGDPLPAASGTLTHLFPLPAAVLTLTSEELAMPASRAATLLRLAALLTDGELNLSPSADRSSARERLTALPGIGPWTVEMVAMRALGDPDAFPATDLGVVRGAATLGIHLRTTAQLWRPWRAYAVQHLWAAHDHPINRIPGPALKEQP